jgi:hypothetical protein
LLSFHAGRSRIASKYMNWVVRPQVGFHMFGPHDSWMLWNGQWPS